MTRAVARSEVARRVGARMRDAAREAGLTQDQVAAALELGGKSVVWRWYEGICLPPVERMEAFAALVGKPLGWFFGAEDLRERTIEGLVRVLAAVMEGRRPSEELGRMLPSGLAGAVTPEMAARVDEMAAELAAAVAARRLLMEWENAPEATRQAALRSMAAEWLPGKRRDRA